MSRRVVVLERGSERVAAVATLLAGRGHRVVVARSTEEATAMVRDQCGAVLIDSPQPDCGGVLCMYVRERIRPMPAMVGVLGPAAVSAEAGREATPHPCHGCMVMLPSDTGLEEIAAAVEAAVRWWPGDD